MNHLKSKLKNLIKYLRSADFKRRIMTNFSAAVAISGIVLTACEAQDIKTQLILVSIGIMMACVGGFCLIAVNRKS